MKIGLVDVDGHNFPNFALMKIAAFHKAKGDSVEWAMPMFGQYDRVDPDGPCQKNAYKTLHLTNTKP